MANDNTLNIEITALIDGFKRGLANATKDLDKFAEKSKKLGKKFESVGSTMTKAFTVPLGILGGVAVSQAVKFEKLAVSLNVLAGSAEKGAVAFERIKKFSAATPFQLDDLVQVNNTLLGFGQTTDEAYKSLTMLADISAVTGSELGNVAVAFGQSAAAGRVMTQDLNQFINNGIPIYKLLGDVTGKNVGELRELASQGGITFDLLNRAFEKGTQKGGMFFNGTANLSKTLGGQLSTMRDNLALLMADFGQIIGEYLAPFIQGISSLAQKFRELSPETKKVIVAVSLLVAAIGPLLVSLGFMMTTVIPALITGYGALTTAVGWTSAAFAKLNTFMMANPVVAITAAVAALVAGLVEVIHTITPAVSRLKTFFNLVRSGGNHAKFLQYQMEDAAAAIEEERLATEKSNKEKKKLASNQYWAAEATKSLTGELLKQKEVLNTTETRPVNVAITGEATGLSAIPNQISDGFIKARETITAEANLMIATLMSFNESASNIINSGVANTFADLGYVIGDALASGGNILEAAGSALLGGLGSVLVQLGEMAITVGVGLLGIKAALQTLNPAVAIAAGVALVALGSFVSSKASSLSGSIGGSGGGGSTDYSSGSSSRTSYGSSTSASSGGGGGTYVFEIAGTKLIGVLKNTLDRNRSLGGSNNLIFAS